MDRHKAGTKPGQPSRNETKPDTSAVGAVVGTHLVNPNWHVALVHVPIGLFAVGMAIELFGFLYARSPARAAGRWMIAIGALAMIPTAVSGVCAVSDVARRSMPPGAAADVAWVDVLRQADAYSGRAGGTGAEGEHWRLVAGHAWRMGPATALAVFSVVVWTGSSDRWRRRIHLPVGLLLLSALGLMAWGGWMGGEMVYRHGTGVRLDDRRALPAAVFPATAPGAAREMTEAKSPRSIAYYVPPLQLHLLLGGAAVAVALAAVGMAFRNTARPEAVPAADEEERLLAGQPDPGRRPAASGDMAMLRSFRPAAAVYVAPEPVPAARTWVLTALLATAASAAGLWFLAGQTDAVERARQDRRPLPAVLWDTVGAPAALPASGTTVPPRPAENPLDLTRRSAHTLAGGAIVVLPILLAVLARWAPRRRLPLGLVTRGDRRAGVARNPDAPRHAGWQRGRV